jgi:hypothetical protein
MVITPLERILWMKYGTIPALVSAYLQSDAQRQRNAEEASREKEGGQDQRGKSKKKKPL